MLASLRSPTQTIQAIDMQTLKWQRATGTIETADVEELDKIKESMFRSKESFR